MYIFNHIDTHLFVHKLSITSSTCTPLRFFPHRVHRPGRSAPRSPDTPPACDAGAGKVWHKVMISGHWSWEAVMSGGAVSVGHAYNCQAGRGLVAGKWWEFW